MRRLIEGKDYSIHKYVTKNKKQHSTKGICKICSECKNSNLCLNRRTLFTMNKCDKCKNCTNKDDCDKFYIYVRYTAELLNLGRNATTGELIRKQFNASSEEETLKKMKAYYIDIKENGMKEKTYHPNQESIISIANCIEEERLKKGEIKSNSYVRLKQTIKTVSTYKFANIPIQKVTKNQIESFLENERNKSYSILKKEYRLLKKAFKYAKKNKIIEQNFFGEDDGIECPNSYRLQSKVQALTRQEEFVLTEYMKKNDTKYNLIILLALYTGMRIGEVLALSPNDKITEGYYGSINISKTLTKDKNGKVIIGNTTKTKKGNRCVQLVLQSKNILEQAINEMIPNKYNVIFCKQNGELYSVDQINSAFKRICKNANIRVKTGKHKKHSKTKGDYYVKCATSDVHIHMLRHTFATRCIEANIPIAVLQNILGHANIQTTVDTYGDIYDYLKQKELSKYVEYMSATNQMLANQQHLYCNQNMSNVVW